MERPGVLIMSLLLAFSFAHFLFALTIDEIIEQTALEAQTKHNRSEFTGEQLNLVELDILENDLCKGVGRGIEMEVPGDDGKGNRIKRKARIPDLKYRWKDGQIPYEFSKDFTPEQIKRIETAIEEYTLYTCVRFVPARKTDHNRVKFVNLERCWSCVGMVGGTQPISLGKTCLDSNGVIIHELGHAIGFYHEQARPDRDEYVIIAEENIPKNVKSNFDRKTWKQVDTYGVPYDYTSVMHYGQNYFSKNCHPSIYAKDKRYQALMGNRDGLSYYDIWIANEMYQCAEQNKCQLVECPVGSFQGPDCRCWCDSGDRQKPITICSGTDPLTTPTPPVVPTPITCEDKDKERCPHLALVGRCRNSFFRVKCPRSCHCCDEPACVDQRDEKYCTRYKKLCDKSPKVRAECSKTCGTC